MSKESSLSKSILYQLVIAVVFTNILFFIDEGFYNFHWMNNLGNWLAFGLYTGVIFLFQWIILLLIRQLYYGRFQLFVSSILGVLLGLILLLILL